MVILIFSCRRECLSCKAKKEDYENPSTRQLQELRLFVIRPDDIHMYFQFDSKCINYWLCKNTQHRISNSLNFQERSLLVTDLGDQNQRLGKQLAEAEEAALDLRAQVDNGNRWWKGLQEHISGAASEGASWSWESQRAGAGRLPWLTEVNKMLELPPSKNSMYFCSEAS